MLYICPTPIGNLKDITLRTLEVLRSVDLIACEDTRDSAKLFNHYEIKASLTSYHEHNRASKTPYLIEKLLEGKNVALISDAGMPGISDPGEDLVAACIENGLEYTVLPGANAALTALVMSGLPTGRFAFEGFLPRTGKERKQLLEQIAAEPRTTILYESPHHLKKSLLDIKDKIKCRKMTIVREISKVYEEKIYTTTQEAPLLYEDTEPRGEYVLVIEGRSRQQEIEDNKEIYKDMSLEEHLAIYIDKGMDKKEAMKAVAADLGISKREVYAGLHRKEE